MADDTSVRIVVAWSPGPRQVIERELTLPAGATVRHAIDASECWDEVSRSAGEMPAVFVWGRAARTDQRLQAGDRVELLRGLRVDPKVARRERFARQGARAAGLFVRKTKPPA